MQKSKYKNILMLVYMGLTTFFLLYGKVYAADSVDCEGETMNFIREIFGWVKISIPVLLILLGSIDFVKAIGAGDEQKMKKAQKDFITRLIIGVVIFFVPSLLEFLLSLVGIDACGIG